MPISTNSAAPGDKVIAVAYTWNGDDATGSFLKFKLERRSDRYVIQPTPPASVLSGDKLRVNRLMLFPNGEASTPLVVDVIPSYHVGSVAALGENSGMRDSCKRN